jgi:hypothetical protein
MRVVHYYMPQLENGPVVKSDRTDIQDYPNLAVPKQQHGVATVAAAAEEDSRYKAEVISRH